MLLQASLYKASLTILLSITCVLLMFVDMGMGVSERLKEALWSFGHVAAFALWTYILLLFASHLLPRGFYTRLLFVVFLSLVVGVIIEVLQPFFNRSRQYEDLWLNCLGTLSAMLFIDPGRVVIPYAILRSLQGLLFIIAVGLLSPAAATMTDEIYARYQFPVLTDFELTSQAGRWAGDEILTIASGVVKGRQMLRVPLATTSYTGPRLKYFPGDWRGYTMLWLRLYNPDDAVLAITCIIHDSHYILSQPDFRQRYQRDFVLQPGWNSFYITLEAIENGPQLRKMNMSQLNSIGFYAYNLPQERIIYIDRIWLD